VAFMTWLCPTRPRISTTWSSAPAGSRDRLQAVDPTVHQSSDGLIWHNHYRLDRLLATLRWQAETLGRLLGVPVAPLVCVHGAHIQRGGLHAQGVAVVPATLVRSALGHDQVLSDADVELLAATARTSLRPAA
jgi:hypothetical protein